ncbi:MAG: hypothetical protein A2014_02220 [Spirochaetes bacterium GWF1_49_6]|nr:MAG: hypothetical protein A2014_02220 [Spirochaetes bacterium GWF1_49_6]
MTSNNREILYPVFKWISRMKADASTSRTGARDNRRILSVAEVSDSPISGLELILLISADRYGLEFIELLTKNWIGEK